MFLLVAQNVYRQGDGETVGPRPLREMASRFFTQLLFCSFCCIPKTVSKEPK